MASAEVHHHRSTTKTSHKPFKSRHATKSFMKNLAKGKLEKADTHGRKTPHQQMMSKWDRKNQARQQRQTRHARNLDATNVFAGQNGAPRIVAMVPISADVNVARAMNSMNDAVGAHLHPVKEGHVRVERFKQNLLYVPATGSLFQIIDACRMADYIVLVFPPTLTEDPEMDMLLRSIEGQGFSNVISVVQDMSSSIPSKKQAQVSASLKAYITHFFPDQDKMLSLDSESECSNAMRSLCSGVPKGVKWRDERSWMMVEETHWLPGDEHDTLSLPIRLTGVVRGRGLKSNRLVQVGDWGCFQVDRITKAPPISGGRAHTDTMNIDHMPIDENVIRDNHDDQEDISELAPYEATMSDADEPADSSIERRGVLLDDHHYFSEDEGHAPEAPKRLPKGTSSYQAAWFLGDISDSGSDYETVGDEEDVPMGGLAEPQDGLEGLDRANHAGLAEDSQSEFPRSEMFDDPSPDEEAAQLAEYRKQKENAASEDLEFPDEIELHPQVLARERLARYRGLKSLKTSVWETSEDKAHEPEDWDRLLQVPDYKRARKQAENDALVGGVAAGTRVNVYLRGVPRALQDSPSSKGPLTLCSLLRHEQKRSVIHCRIALRSDYPEPLKSKSELVVQCGPRRFLVKPVFSQAGNTPNDVHKFVRFLHPGQTAIASFIAPVTWAPAPVLFFEPSKSPVDPPPLIATGTNLPPSTSRIIAKRVVLTGHPYKIHKKLVTVRYMFFNTEDILWFKALPLWTKWGRSGFIKESLGTHGYFKATFDAKINPQDAVGVSLYKRVWPRPATAWEQPKG